MLAEPRRLAARAGLVQTSPMIKRALVVVLVLALSACGFHLRGALQLPADLGPVMVKTPDPYSPLGQSLADALDRSGIATVATGATGATGEHATLQVVSEKWGNTPLSVDAFGRAEEYTLHYAVFFRLLRADGSELVPQQALELTRDYVSVATRSAGTESERDILARELQREMVGAILRRIDAVARMPAQVPAATP
jgi:LPS-assembly lipoprotein